MKRNFSLSLLIAIVGSLHAQIDTSNVDMGDTVRGVQIVERYLRMIDFQQERTDSILYVETSVVDREHPHDTMWIYRWYKSPRCIRTVMEQDGVMQDGYFSDGKEFFHKFRSKARVWSKMTRESFWDNSHSLDIRGPLHEWRSQGAEIHYAGEYQYNGNTVDRVYVTCPFLYDRFYFFERKTGLLFLVTEHLRTYADNELHDSADPVDWRAWGEFVPVHNFLLPKTESYQFHDQVVIITNKYRYLPPSMKPFTEEYCPKP